MSPANTGRAGPPRDNIKPNFANHPGSDEASLNAARRTVALLAEVKPDDIVLACFTGGSSSLFVSPVDSVSLEDKAATNRILLTCGANILEINAVRKHSAWSRVSSCEGSRRARISSIWTVSDVIGDFLDYITDPSVPDTSCFADAQATLDKNYELWSRVPENVAVYLREAPAHAETVRAEALAHLHRTDILLVKADAACAGAAEAARRLGLSPYCCPPSSKESGALGRNLAAIAKQVVRWNPVPAPCILIGGRHARP